ncbi:hypothetical protein SBADM41S_01126 [Streptomyces badius]
MREEAPAPGGRWCSAASASHRASTLLEPPDAVTTAHSANASGDGVRTGTGVMPNGASASGRTG